MTSVYENKFDVIFRKLQDEKAQLKKDFDSAYSKDDFRTSMGIMEEIQEVMNKLSALESVEKPFKEIAQISSRVEDLKLEIEIHLEELGKQIKSMDELQCLIDGELETPMKTLRELFSREAERSFTFNFNKFSDDELMTLIHYRKSNFPSRLSAYEDYWTQTVNSEVAKHLGNSQGSTNSREDNNLDLDAPLNVETGDSLNSNCYLDNDEDLSSNTIQISKSAEESPTFDHGVQNLSDFERRNHIPVLTDEETSRILADSEVESVGVEFATPVNSEPSDGSNQISGEQAEIAITAEEIESYESEVTELFDVDEKLRENGFDSIETNEEELTISVEDIEQDLISESMEKVEKVSLVSSDDDFSVSVEELENEFVANSVDSENTEDQYTEVEHAEDHYTEDEYTQDEYAEEGYAEGEYSQDEYSEEDYAEGEYTQDEYAEEGYAEGEYTIDAEDDIVIIDADGLILPGLSFCGGGVCCLVKSQSPASLTNLVEVVHPSLYFIFGCPPLIIAH